ncbi:DUF3159 domain-containing protein [Galbitalea sp. SE-J8]|uniref:DUF3159 domain-containing protein n=1 Tax=Galbitalea sp. SE-J8 TaxID=3054952 RepID=UPI00259CBFD3|nr:DUF3159 domain-containing protein [Galbitalea sp. SE-J8]MDM4763202.1 DUF3159 domain-containing protein [Galbitalea sp. SE-J8]
MSEREDRPAPGAPEDGAAQPGFAELFTTALRGSALSRLAPGELPSGAELLRVVGGVRGVVESVLPGLAFLIAFAITNIVLGLDQPVVVAVSVGVPLVLCIVFLVIRGIAREAVRPALTGVLVAAVTAVLALITGRAQDSFVPGIVINVVSLVVLLVTLVARWPLVGLVVGALSGDLTGWRAVPAKCRVLTIGTWFWVGLFALRLVVELPLYLASLGDSAAFTPWLAAAKLVLGVPFYALVLWLTWLFVSPAFAPADRAAGDTAEPPQAS